MNKALTIVLILGLLPVVRAAEPPDPQIAPVIQSFDAIDNDSVFLLRGNKASVVQLASGTRRELDHPVLAGAACNSLLLLVEQDQGADRRLVMRRTTDLEIITAKQLQPSQHIFKIVSTQLPGREFFMISYEGTIPNVKFQYEFVGLRSDVLTLEKMNILAEICKVPHVQWIFNSKRDSTFAFSGLIDEEKLKATGCQIEKSDDTGPNSYLVLIEKGKVSHAWQVAVPVAFSTDGTRLLMKRVIPGKPSEHPFMIFDIAKKVGQPVNYLPRFDSILSTRGSLSAAIGVTADYIEPNKFRWRIELAAQDREPMEVVNFVSEPFLAGSARDEWMYVTDGSRIWADSPSGDVTNVLIHD